MSEMSVRTWQERFRAGDFSSRDRAVQCEAGWYDWFCRDDALAGRLKKISGVVLGITDPFILDNYYVWFKNNCPLEGPLYDDVRFEPLTGERDGKYFVVSLDSPHEHMKWALVTERYGYDAPEFECGNVRDMVKYINAIAPELARGIQPRFVQEKAAVGEYVRQHEGKSSYSIRRAGDHLFAYQSPRDWKYRTVAVSCRTCRTALHALCFPKRGARTGQGRRAAARTAQEGADAMTRRFNGRPALPPDAKDEILHVLFANMEISGDEIAAILKKHHVSCDADVLQDRYRRQLGQRLMASLRDASGEREVLSNGRGRYVVLECCRDRQQLAAIRRRIQNQAHGLNASAGKVRARIAVLDRLIACLRKAA